MLLRDYILAAAAELINRRVSNNRRIGGFSLRKIHPRDFAGENASSCRVDFVVGTHAYLCIAQMCVLVEKLLGILQY